MSPIANCMRFLSFPPCTLIYLNVKLVYMPRHGGWIALLTYVTFHHTSVHYNYEYEWIDPFSVIVNVGWVESTDNSSLSWTCWRCPCSDWSSCKYSPNGQGEYIGSSFHSLYYKRQLMYWMSLGVHRMAGQHLIWHHSKATLMLSVYWLRQKHKSTSVPR